MPISSFIIEKVIGNLIKNNSGEIHLVAIYCI